MRTASSQASQPFPTVCVRWTHAGISQRKLMTGTESLPIAGWRAQVSQPGDPQATEASGFEMSKDDQKW